MHQESAKGQLYKRAAVLCFGVLYIVFGILLVLLDTVDVALKRPEITCIVLPGIVIGSGFWTGAFFIVAGIVGILAGQRIPPNEGPRARRSSLITTLIFSILGLHAALALSALSILSSVYFLNDCFNQDFSGFIITLTHAVIFCIMVLINVGQLVSISVNLHRMPPPPVTNARMIAKPELWMIATAVNTHPPV
ncbi:uncharacterized protein LOC129588347 [Paramacrobiotus metropolitanus]|uniref:uncharacterized protein LOC129588347 n=1 Tax=Paramacrobiotus metropolitanus TaxID=2943436 RepID=UPI0024462E34|nr:uncharacterized protein LOC129588347 [Paramacrobiotus metropolitanus]